MAAKDNELARKEAVMEQFSIFTRRSTRVQIAASLKQARRSICCAETRKMAEAGKEDSQTYFGHLKYPASAIRISTPSL